MLGDSCSQRGDRSLVGLWRAGNEAAATELFQRYASRLIALARSRLDQKLSRRVDPEDIVQSVFRTFFKRAREGRFVLHSERDVFHLLVRITVFKTLRQVAFHRAHKRQAALEAGPGAEDDPLCQLLSREPTPESVNCFLEEMQWLLEQLSPQEQEILALRIQGYTSSEIAERLGTYDRKVRRVMERIRGLAEKRGIGS
ncbi:MAG: hypothetical protein C4297_03280 [Gemmataceae bacterium]